MFCQPENIKRSLRAIECIEKKLANTRIATVFNQTCLNEYPLLTCTNIYIYIYIYTHTYTYIYEYYNMIMNFSVIIVFRKSPPKYHMPAISAINYKLTCYAELKYQISGQKLV